jgi:hypothetical protein
MRAPFCASSTYTRICAADRFSSGCRVHRGEAMTGQVDARNFSLVNEPRLKSMVSTRGDGSQSLNDAVKRDIDTSVVQFERGFARIEKGEKYLKISDGALRGPLLGTTFQGTLFDAAATCRSPALSCQPMV